PGNVVQMDVEAVPLKLAFGRIQFNNQTNISTRISGGMAPVTVDKYGLFQLETPASTSSLQVEMDNGWTCQIKLPADDGGNIIRLGTVQLSEDNCLIPADDGLAVGGNEAK
ncbi:peptidase associated/transthyretin-like domain-containing protein, partial [Sansalvadorimonas verongulae]|uniref:CS1-pili formation C-terminal domain-containing protein n=1 Tax=Sansalvadorimonas verongulae TaxID=2172824 RepID=UPI0012BB5606